MRINEVSKEYFLKTVSNIVGDKLLKQAASQYQMQAQRSPQTNPSNYSLSGQVSGQQTAPSGSVTGDEQKGYPWAHTIPMRQAIASTRPICIRLIKWETCQMGKGSICYKLIHPITPYQYKQCSITCSDHKHLHQCLGQIVFMHVHFCGQLEVQLHHLDHKWQIPIQEHT
ncbi:Transcription initiation factor TFIID subunit 4b [Zea mays]|uniref:Transcription initiation factor TFIID subunit 4b n=2 Tax=Zea mays TaxID=4577 RepID=A0A1D6KM98_MAIZE|nr:Transcription initiation factor TFIID subunit 4b [Zea mays]